MNGQSQIDYSKLAALRLFGAFFEGLPAFVKTLSRLKLQPATPAAERFLKLAAEHEALAENCYPEYERLFYGTDASVFIPLWASACGTNGPVLLDQTTLDLILFCREWGFEPPVLDGNPPDFIGSQLAFLAYLEGCALHAQAKGGGAEQFCRATDEFTQRFLVDTVMAVQSGVREHCGDAIITALVGLLAEFVSEGFAAPFTLAAEGVSALLAEFTERDVLENGRRPALETAPERTVLTCGINNCGSRCVVRVRTRAGCILDVSTDCSERAPQLRACLRGRGYRRTFLNATRLRYPMKRIGKRGEGKFTRITWEEAAELTAREAMRIRDEYASSARYFVQATGNEAVLRGDHFMKRLMNLDGGFMAVHNSYSVGCVREIAPYIYGDHLGGHSIEDMLNTNLLILWGNNPAETLFGAERNYTMMQLKKKGVRIIVIDPRESDSAIAYADEWIGIKPSSDGALADAMAYVIYTEGLWDKAFMDKYTIGFDPEHMPEGVPGSESCTAYLLGERDGVPKTPQWAQDITGVPAETITRLAREYAAAKPACLYQGLGVQRVGNGEQTIRCLALLTALTGNVGIPGGSSCGNMATANQATVAFPQGEAVYPGHISHFMWFKLIDEGVVADPEEIGLRGVDHLDAGIKMVFSIACNTLVNQHSNINNTIRILQDESKCEFIVNSDLFMTASAKFSDLQLPAASLFENDNFTHSWGVGATGDFVLCNNKVIEPIFGSQFEWDWVCAVAEKMGHYEAFVDGKPTLEQWRRFLYDDLRAREPELPAFEDFCAAGGYTYKERRTYVAYQQQREDLERHPFATPSGKIELYSGQIAAMNDPENRPAIPRYVPCAEGPEDPLRTQYPLQLVGWHTKRRAHSVHDNNPWLEEAEPQRVWMNPEDANARSVCDGEVVRVFNGRGEIHIPVYVTRRVIPGVVAIPQGAWYTPNKDGIDVRGNLNVLTSTHAPTPYSKGNPQHTNLVDIARF